MSRALRSRFRRYVLLPVALVLSVSLSGCFSGSPNGGGGAGAACAAPDITNWVHFDRAHSTGYVPTAAWNIVDAANSTTLSSPVGDAAVGIAFAADPFFFFNSVDEVANYFFSTGGSITNVSIVSASAPYSFAGGTQRDFEFDAVNQSELAGPGTPVHGWFTALLVPGQYFLTWLEIAHRNVAGAYCGTLFALRTLLKRL